MNYTIPDVALDIDQQLMHQFTIAHLIKRLIKDQSKWDATRMRLGNSMDLDIFLSTFVFYDYMPKMNLLNK